MKAFEQHKKILLDLFIKYTIIINFYVESLIKCQKSVWSKIDLVANLEKNIDHSLKIFPKLKKNIKIL